MGRHRELGIYFSAKRALGAPKGGVGGVSHTTIWTLPECGEDEHRALGGEEAVRMPRNSCIYREPTTFGIHSACSMALRADTEHLGEYLYTRGDIHLPRLFPTHLPYNAQG